MVRVGEEFPLECPGCGGDIRLIAFITDSGPIRKILAQGSDGSPGAVTPSNSRSPSTFLGRCLDQDLGRGSLVMVLRPAARSSAPPAQRW